MLLQGGTEANFAALWWHRESLKQHSDKTPIVIASNKSHYSINKIANQLQLGLVLIETSGSGIDLNHLEQQLKNISLPVIFCNNFGTTVEGIIDNVVVIKKLLQKYLGSNFRIHGDGALYGVVIPYLPLYSEINCIFDYVDTLAISGHKFLGAYFISGVVLSKRSYIDSLIRENKSITYLQDVDDVTVSGSRSGFLALELHLLLHAALQSVAGKTRLEQLWNECVSRATWFFQKIANVVGNDNPDLIFNPNQINVVIPAPSSENYRNFLAEKYKLMALGNTQYGICVLPRSIQSNLQAFIEEYTESRNHES